LKKAVEQYKCGLQERVVRAFFAPDRAVTHRPSLWVQKVKGQGSSVRKRVGVGCTLWGLIVGHDVTVQRKMSVARTGHSRRGRRRRRRSFNHVVALFTVRCTCAPSAQARSRGWFTDQADV